MLALVETKPEPSHIVETRSPPQNVGEVAEPSRVVQTRSPFQKVGGRACGGQKNDFMKAMGIQEAAQGASTEGEYGLMFYKATWSVAIRQKFGEKRQVLSITNRNIDREELEEVAGKCIKRLKRGEAVDGVKAWGLKQAARIEASNH